MVMLRGGQVLEDPTNTELAAAWGHRARRRPRVRRSRRRRGPGGAGRRGVRLRGARDARDRARVDRRAGGLELADPQLPRVSRGVSGAELGQRAYQQAWVLGTEFVHMREVTGLRPSRPATWSRSPTAPRSPRGVVLATGVTYRRIEVPSLLALAGKGVFYGTSNSEVRALRGHHVHVVGGGNSAGQAAMQLRRFASRVTLVVREPDVASACRTTCAARSRRRPTSTSASAPRSSAPPGRAARAAHRARQLHRGDRELETAAMFVLIGARPHTEWLPATTRGRAATF